VAEVFISYRKTPERRAIVRRLAVILRAYGLSVWWDDNLVAGEKYRERIIKELDEARIVAPLWCEESIVSEWVLNESAMGAGKLMPAFLQRVPPPQAFEGFHAADLTGWDGAANSPRLQNYVREICTKLGRPAVVPIDLMEELSSLPALMPLPDLTSEPTSAASTIPVSVPSPVFHSSAAINPMPHKHTTLPNSVSESSLSADIHATLGVASPTLHGRESVRAAATVLGRLLVSAFFLIAFLLLLRVFGAPSIVVGGVPIQVEKAWVAILLLTAAHFYYGEALINELARFRRSQTPQACRSLFDDITGGGSYALQGFKARVRVPNSRIWIMSSDDPTTWRYYAAAIGLLIVCLPTSLAPLSSFFLHLLLSLLVPVGNWMVGSRWAIALSELVMEDEDVVILGRKS
jgi:hypothetical protein